MVPTKNSNVLLLLVSCLTGSLISIGHAQLGPCTIETVVGGGTGARGDGGLAVNAELFNPFDARVGADGLLYIADTNNVRIRRVTAEGIIETFAGTGEVTSSGDGGPASMAGLLGALSMAFAADGSLIFLDSDLRIRRIGPDGIITTVAGGDRNDFSGDGGPAIGAGLDGSRRIALGTDGAIYIAAQTIHRIRKVTPDGQINTIAGTSPTRFSVGESTGDGGRAVDAGIDRPSDIAVAPDGTVYFVEAFGRSVRRIAPNGIIDTYLIVGFPNQSPDGTPRSEAIVGGARNIEIDKQGRVYWLNGHTLRRVSLEDTMETVWDTESPVFGSGSRLSVGGEGIFHVFGDDRVFRLAPGGEQILVAGVGLTASRGDGGPANEAVLGFQLSVDVGPNGEIYIADRTFDRVRVVRDGRIDTFAGTGEGGVTEEGLPATQAKVDRPLDVAEGPDGTLFLATRQAVFRVDPATGIITRHAGGGAGFCRGGLCRFEGPALEAALSTVEEIEVDSESNLYILHDPFGRQRGGDWISQVSPDGVIRLLSDETPAGPNAGRAGTMTVDGKDNLVLTEGFIRPRFWRMDAEENFTAVEGAEGFVAGSLAMAADGIGNLYIATRSDHLQRLTVDGVLNTIVPVSPDGPGFGGDGGPAMEAVLRRVRSVALDRQGNLYLADEGNQRIRRINSIADCPVVVRPQIAAFGVRHAASFSFTVAPGTIVAIFGIRLGPEIGINGRVEGGRFTAELAGTRVWVDDRPSPITYSSATQVNAIIPYATEVNWEFDEEGNFVRQTRNIEIRVEYEGVSSEPFAAVVAPAWPDLFRLPSGLAAAFNQDGTLNEPLNPAAPGSIVVVFGSGEGLTDPPSVDGQLAGDVLPRPVLEPAVTIGGQPAEILYFGAAPGLVAGVFQLNARVPEGLTVLGAVEIHVRVGPFPSSSFPPKIIVGR